MNITDKKMLILGASGLIGSVIAKKILAHQPSEIILHALTEELAKEALGEMPSGTDAHMPIEWGNIFFKNNIKDISYNEFIKNQTLRKELVKDFLSPLTGSSVKEYYLFQLINRYQPDIIVDAVNTASSIAYKNFFETFYSLNSSKQKIKESKKLSDEMVEDLDEKMDNLFLSNATSQLIHHSQVFFKSMMANKTKMYLKIGTTGTGGMGFNIPFTHGESNSEKLLLEKACMGGAQSSLIFLMARTPDAPICKEIKPATFVGWKKIDYGEIFDKGAPIPLYDCLEDSAFTLSLTNKLFSGGSWESLEENLKSVFLDCGENGRLSLGEFESVTAVGLMEFVTPEEVANTVIEEITGKSSHNDIITSLNNSVIRPTYIAGNLRDVAIKELKNLEKKYGLESVSFERLGPRIGKILWESFLLKACFKDVTHFLSSSSDDAANKIQEFLLDDKKIRSTIISIGLPILLKDGERVLKGPNVKVPLDSDIGEKGVQESEIENWAYYGWVDLREKNIKIWQDRFKKMLDYAKESEVDLSSPNYYLSKQCVSLDKIDVGKVSAWILINEDHAKSNNKK